MLDTPIYSPFRLPTLHERNNTVGGGEGEEIDTGRPRAYKTIKLDRERESWKRQESKDKGETNLNKAGKKQTAKGEDAFYNLWASSYLLAIDIPTELGHDRDTYIFWTLETFWLHKNCHII